MRAPFLPPSDVDAGDVLDDGLSTRSWWAWVGALAAAACVGWVPFAGRALSPDEGGYLVLAAQWAPGSSLYGDYWVDRPPVLVGLFDVADELGGAWALRSMGIVAVVLSVLLAGVIGRMVAPSLGRAALLPAATAAVFIATPLLGGSVVNGELLGVPFVLVGVLATLAALRSSARWSAIAWALAAGAAGATAFLIKQSLADVFVFVLAVALSQWRSGLRLLAGAAGGAIVTAALVLWAADARGTSPADLWDAVVTFRGQAGAVIAESATTTTATRLGGLVLALVGSGAPLVAAALTWAARRRRARPTDGDRRIDLLVPAYALLGWEAFVVLLGGSYWVHYLMGLVPGLVVLAAAAAQQRPRVRTFAAAYAFAAVSTVAAIGWVLVNPIERPEAPAIAYLEDHARPGDTGVVAFGAANILEAAELESPYPYLWSLPVRVRDSELLELAEVLAGPEAPTWLVVSGSTLGSWGIDGAAAETYVAERYALATHAGRFNIYHRNDVS